MNAEVIYYGEKVGYSVGQKSVFFRVLTKKNRTLKNKLLKKAQNVALMDVGSSSDIQLKKILTDLRQLNTKKKVILSYASTLDALKDYINKETSNYSFENIISVISSSEMLYDSTRSDIENIFNTKVYSRYANQENGVIGQDNFINNNFILNEASYIIEIFKLEEDVLALDGEVGRIVVTDLFNYAMPMIRYDTGDLGQLDFIDVDGIKKKVIKNFGGRKVDIVYDTLGNKLSPHIITNNLWSFPEIEQFQFIQRSSTEYAFKINVKSPFKEEKLILLFKEILGEKAIIKVEYVEEIPLLSSGKRKYIINEGMS